MKGLTSCLFALASIFALAGPTARAGAPESTEVAVPQLSAPVIDQAEILSGDLLSQLNTELRQYPPALQLEIWTIPSLNGESIESLSMRAATKWSLGKKGTDKGVLIVIAMQDRRMRIEVGRGLEGAIPDILAGRIVDRVLRPEFRAGRYAEGILEASRTLRKLAIGELNPADVNQQEALSDARAGARMHSPLVFILFVVLGILMLLIRLLDRATCGPGANARIRRNRWYGGSGGGFGGFGGGGGWSGGGGGFSGGGSSGSW